MSKSTNHHSTRSVLFVNGIAADGPQQLFATEAFRIVRFSEREIAAWQDLRSRLVRVDYTFEDGRRSWSEAHAGGKDVPPPWWDVSSPCSDPARLADAWAIDSRIEGEDVHLAGLFAGRLVNLSRLARAAFLLVRLSGGGTVTPVREFLFRDEEERSRAGTRTGRRPGNAGIEDWATWKADDAHLRALARTTRCLWRPLSQSLESLPDDCTVLIDHFIFADQGSWDDWELDLWVCLEAMFGQKDAEVLLRVSQNCALFVAGPSDGFAISKELRDRYRLRSEIVHGSRSPNRRINTPFAEIFTEKARLEEIVRIAARRYLRLRLVERLSRDQIHERLRKAPFDRTEVDTLPGDPAGDHALDPGAPGSREGQP